MHCYNVQVRVVERARLGANIRTGACVGDLRLGKTSELESRHARINTRPALPIRRHASRGGARRPGLDGGAVLESVIHGVETVNAVAGLTCQSMLPLGDLARPLVSDTRGRGDSAGRSRERDRVAIVAVGGKRCGLPGEWSCPFSGTRTVATCRAQARSGGGRNRHMIRQH